MRLTKDWVSTKEVLEMLGICPKHLYKLRKNEFKQGVHYRDIRGKTSLRPTYKWNLKKIEILLNQGAEKR
jgi:hypothetical protein